MATMKTNGSTRKTTLFSTIRYEHLVAGFSGGVTSTLILHPLDLIKIRFAGTISVCFISLCAHTALHTHAHTQKDLHV